MEYVKDLKPVFGNPVLDSLDGSKRAPLRAILSKSWSETERAEFGVYAVDTTVPAGKVWDGDFVEVDGKPVANFRDPTPEEILASVPWQTLASAQVALCSWINDVTYQIEGKYPRVIRAEWDKEEAMALAYKLGTETQGQLAELTTLAATKNRTVNEHVDRVLWLAGTFHTIKGQVHNLWLATDAALEAAQSPLEYHGIFEAAKQQAAPLAAAYGLEA